MLEIGDRIRICSHRHDNEVEGEVFSKEGTVKSRSQDFLSVELDSSITLKRNNEVHQLVLLRKSDVVKISDLEEKVERAL